MLKESVKRDAVENAPEIQLVTPNKSCETCAMMKATHSPMIIPSREICLEPGDVVAADVVGPYDVSLDKFKYVLTVQDLNSGMVSAIPIKTKGEATGKIMKWIQKFNNLSKWKVKRLRTDNALEFVRSKDMADFLGSEGIVHEKTVPYKHHQNGAVERVNRTLSEMAQALLHLKRLPKYL
jgi:hypothetical protein